MKSPYLLLLLFPLCFCKSNKFRQVQHSPDLTDTAVTNHPVADAKAKVKPETITLIVESSGNDAVSPYYEDEFQDLHHLYIKKDSVSKKFAPVTIKTKHAIWLRFATSRQNPVYLQPGDTLYIKGSNKEPVEYVFDGKRPGEHNFFTLMHQKRIGSLGYSDIMGLDINNYQLQRRTKMYHFLLNERRNFIDQVKDSLALSWQFYKFFRAELTTEAISGLLAPFYSDKFDYQKLPQRYIDTLNSFGTSGWFKQDSLVFSSPAYRRSIWHYNRFLSRKALRTSKELTTLYEDAKTKYTGQVRNFALFYLLNNSIKEEVSIENYLVQFRKDCTYQPYIYYLDSLDNRPAKLVTDEAFLNNNLQTDTDKTITWREILNKNKGKVIYIDLWATWCGPCLEEMTFSRKLQAQLKEKDISFINISLDFPKDKDKWKKTIIQQKLNAVSNQNYMLDGKSPLASFIHGNPDGISVPHYVIINKDGKVSAINAKRPSDPQLREDLLKLLNNSAY